MASELKKVLYLEDDANIARVAMISMTRFSDLEVIHCERGEAAIEAFEDFQPDLLLFDVMLPDMDGVQTLKNIQSLEHGRDVPVVFMTAKAQVHEQQKYMDLGALSVIVKPFNAMSLGATLKSLWESRHLNGVTQSA